ncbi:MAG: hypothetical protein K0Q48_663 [Bacillota bacterium]|nr:hypothetical protein [Bacillota bacterium]
MYQYWQYKVVRYNQASMEFNPSAGFDPMGIEMSMFEYGDDMWELVSVFPNAGTNSILFFYKKLITLELQEELK